MRVLFSGDVAGNAGRAALAVALPALRSEHGPFDFVVVNCENAASNGKGMTEKIFHEMLDMGVDAMTSGNHIWDRGPFFPTLDADERVFRPANCAPACPGRGWGVVRRGGKALGILNLEGQVFMPPIDSPFRSADVALDELRAKEGDDLPILVDFHAEATSEKAAMGHYLDGRVSVVLGTHTHVQTADERILPKGTAYMTDVGMTGGHGGLIGVKPETVLPRFLTGMLSRFEQCEDEPAFDGALIEIDDATGLAVSMTRIHRPVSIGG